MIHATEVEIKKFKCHKDLYTQHEVEYDERMLYICCLTIQKLKTKS